MLNQNTTSPSRLSHVLDVLTNCALLVAAVLLSVVLVRTYLHPNIPPTLTITAPQRSSSVQPTDQVVVGSNVKSRLTDVRWNSASQTLVFVLSTRCHYCTESAPFFKHLRSTLGNDTRFIGVLPQRVSEAEKYLDGEGVSFDEVRQLPLDKTGVAGTPTIWLVNKNGIVTQVWVGKLTPDKEEEALKLIRGNTSPDTKAEMNRDGFHSSRMKAGGL